MKLFFSFLASFILVFCLLSLLIEIRQSASIGMEEMVVPCEDLMHIDATTLDRSHSRSWELSDYPAAFCTNYHSYEVLAQQSELERNNINPLSDDYAAYWGSVYRALVRQNTDWVRFVADSLVQVANYESLDANGLAALTVSFVQDIPYNFISPKACEEASAGNYPCVSMAKFGILSPYEFLHTQSGDCDTRAVLLFSLLEQMNFNPMIVVSDEYRHAMLALDIPASGDHITLGRKNYYFWETTAKGWPVGMIPPDMQNLDYWHIALVHEL